MQIIARPIRISDLRPISLLFTDFTILSGVLAESMKPLLHEVIHDSKKGGVPKISLLNPLSLFRDIIRCDNGGGGEKTRKIALGNLWMAPNIID